MQPCPVIVVDSVSYSILQLTSKTEREGYVIKDWKKAGLKKPSVIRTDRLVVLRKSDFKAYVGTLTERDVEGFLDYLRSKPPYH